MEGVASLVETRGFYLQDLDLEEEEVVEVDVYPVLLLLLQIKILEIISSGLH